MRPNVSSVNGCRGGGLLVDPPSECPTVGGVNITINGDYFGGAEDAVSVTVDGRECHILERSRTVIVVNLTAGAGVDRYPSLPSLTCEICNVPFVLCGRCCVGRTVTVYAYGLLSSPNKNARLSYKRAQVVKLVSSQCNQQVSSYFPGLQKPDKPFTSLQQGNQLIDCNREGGGVLTIIGSGAFMPGSTTRLCRIQYLLFYRFRTRQAHCAARSSGV